jgi:hypothetical protein
MSIEEQQELKQKNYAEAIRYMNNAGEALQKSGKEGKHYKDAKYVRTACGTAYCGTLLALDTYLKLKDVELPKKKRRSIEFYLLNVGRLDRKMLQHLNDVHEALHLAGYYDGSLNANIIREGFDAAYEIIDRIKPITANG